METRIEICNNNVPHNEYGIDICHLLAQKHLSYLTHILPTPHREACPPSRPQGGSVQQRHYTHGRHHTQE